MHNIAGTTGLLALAIAPLALWVGLRNDLRWKGFATYSLVTAVVALIAFASLGAQSFWPWRGAVQRLLVGSLYTWILVAALRVQLLLWHGDMAKSPV